MRYTFKHVYSFDYFNSKRDSILIILLSISTSFSFQPINPDTIFRGFATFYGYNGGGNCCYPAPDTPAFTCAMNQSQYENSQLCGACIEVTGEKGSVMLRVEDRLPEGAFGDIDVNTPVFHFIDDPIKGKVPVKWKIVPCPVQGPIQFYFQEGSSQYWASVQIRNHRYPVKLIEYKKDGVYRPLTWYMHNFFIEQRGIGSGPFDFRITDIYGQSIEETSIPLIAQTIIPGTQQFKIINSSILFNSSKNKLNQLLSITPVSTNGFNLLNRDHETILVTIYTINGKVMQKITIASGASAQVLTSSSALYFIHSTPISRSKPPIIICYIYSR